MSAVQRQRRGESRLRKHLGGGARYGGHELSHLEANELLAVSGAPLSERRPPNGVADVGPAPAGPRGERDPVASGGMALPPGSDKQRRELSWQRELRERQRRWREQRGYPVDPHHPLGSRFPMPEAEQQLWNFLTPSIGDLVRRECAENANASPADHKLYSHDRLFGNLLSSQPLAFNLFGELKLNLELATAVARRLWPTRVDRVEGLSSSGHRGGATLVIWATERLRTSHSSARRRRAGVGSSS